ncbi:MAG: hypothetical protein GY950_27395, partial [bacterium]|nr:hypothetical protein [bacterium]
MNTFNKKDVEDIFSLTPLQESILYYYLKNPDSSVYSEQLRLEINGALDLEIFSRAWDTVCRNNEMLRAVFRWETVKQPVQVILKKHEIDLEYIDLPDLKDKKEEQDGSSPFDLRKVPFRLRLYKRDENNYSLIISNHHIIYDGWSNGVLLKEFFETYDELYAGKTPQKPAKTKFKNYVKWLQNRDRDNHGAEEKFWNDYLGQKEKRRIKRGRTGKSAHKNTRIIYSSEEKKAIDLFLEKNKLTSSILIYCTWGLLLQHYFSKMDVLFDTTVSGRTGGLKGIEETVGLFINTLPLRLKTQPGEPLLKLLRRTSTQLHLRGPFETTSRLIVNEILDTNGGNEILESLVVIENYPLDKAAMREKGVLKVDSFAVTGRSTYDLTVMVTDFDGLDIDISYKENLFNEKNIGLLAGHFDSILKEIIRDPAQKTGELPDLPEVERERLLDVLQEEKIDDELIILPENSTQERLVGIWAEILRVDKDSIGINSDFFSFGG